MFHSYVCGAAVKWVKDYKETGKKSQLRLMIGENRKVPSIDPDEVGKVAAHLLALEDVSIHNKKRYVLSGPAPITGRGLVDIVEKHAGTNVDDVKFGDMSFIDDLALNYPENIMKANRIAVAKAFSDNDSALAPAPTSPEVNDLYMIEHTAAQWTEERCGGLK